VTRSSGKSASQSRTAPLNDEDLLQYAVYEVREADGSLAYIGQSDGPVRRFAYHIWKGKFSALAKMPGWTAASAKKEFGCRERWAPVAAAERAKRLALAKAGPAKEVRPARGPR
jgi:hypothetical protein